MIRRRALTLAVFVLLLAGCGGGDESSDTGGDDAGAKVFATAGCGGCHTLTAAASTGTVGPSLDTTSLSADRIARQVRRGGNGMPAFESTLSDDEIAAVAAYVGGASKGGGNVAGKFKPDETVLADCGTGGEHLPRAGVRQPRVRGRRQGGDRRAGEEDGGRRSCPGRLPSHRPLDRRGDACPERRERRQGVRGGVGHCGSGFYHGLIERAFVGVPGDELGLRSPQTGSATTRRSGASGSSTTNASTGSGTA